MKISYSGIILDDASHRGIANWARSFASQNIPYFGDWEIIAHHMTSCLGPLPDKLRSGIGKPFTLKVTHYAFDKKVFALKVTGFPSSNEHPHITVAVNRKQGGKPMMSNQLTEWIDISKAGIAPPLALKGTLQEIGQGANESKNTKKK
jgi:hypothetical protein